MLNRTIIADEFAFRHLQNEVYQTEWRAIDRLEADCLQARSMQRDIRIDLSRILQALILDETPAGSPLDLLLRCLMQTVLPTQITPGSFYGLHAPFPSPRSYYPLRFAISDHEDSRTAFWFDPAEPCLSGSAQTPMLDEHASCFLVGVRAEFSLYASLYNHFRKALFALELGHFVACFDSFARNLGLEIRVLIPDSGPKISVQTLASRNPDVDSWHHTVRDLRLRNSGRFDYGLLPRPLEFDEGLKTRLINALQSAQLDANRILSPVEGEAIEVKFCLNDGLYCMTNQGLECVAEGDHIKPIEAAYLYPNFNFHGLAAVIFFSVPNRMLHCIDREALRLNILLGFLAQRLIEAGGAENFARPFRSYDQIQTDHILQNSGMKSYYGVMVGRNRYTDTLGILL